MKPDHPWFFSLQQLRRVAALTLLGALLGLGLGWVLPPKFRAGASVAIVKTGNVVNFDPRFKTVTELEATLDQTARRRSLALVASSPVIAASVLEQLRGRISLRTVEALQETVDTRLNGDLITIDATSGDAAQAALIANAWAGDFIARANTIFAENPVPGEDLDKLAQAMRGESDAKEEALVRFLRQNEINEIASFIDRKSRQLADALAIETKLDRLLDDSRALKARLAANGKIVARGDDLAAALLESSAFSNWSTVPVTLQVPIDQLVAPGTDLSSTVDSLITALAERRAALNSEEATTLRAEINVLGGQLETETARKTELLRARDLARDTYSTLATKTAEGRAAAAIKGSVARMALPAIVPDKPESPKSSWYSAMGALLGLGAGLALAFGTGRRAYRASGAAK
jgi:LPS O-antigen subunit length determinant protein (WzzB/FepE family)